MSVSPGMLEQNPTTSNHQQLLLQVRDLKTEFVTEYGIVKAVNGVSFEVEHGRTLGVVGESGCGKSVTALSVMRLIESPPGKIASGEVLFEGVDLLKLSEDAMRQVRGGKIAMIFQDPMTSLNPVYTIADQLIEPLKVHLRLSQTACRKRAAELLELVGIPEPQRAMDDYPHQFSGGMRQRAMIAMALACNPKLLIADEPTTALDVTVQEQLLELMEDLRNRLNMSVIWITHDLGVVAGIADQVLVMYAGNIVESGPVHQIFKYHRHPYTRGLLRSIPRLDVSHSLRLEAIPGSPPDLIHPPPGCAFAPRCRYFVDCCLREQPPLYSIAQGHYSACFVNPESEPLQQELELT